MIRFPPIWLFFLGLTGCITQLQEVPIHYAELPPKVVTPPPPEAKPVVAKEEQPPQVKSKKAEEPPWSPAPRLNDGHTPAVVLQTIPKEEAAEKGEPEPEIKPPPPPAKVAAAVKAAPVPPPAVKPPPPPPPPGSADYYVRIGSFPNKEQAEKLAWRAVNEWSLSIKEELVLIGGKKLYQVNAGPYASQQLADETARRLQEQEKVHGDVFYIPVSQKF